MANPSTPFGFQQIPLVDGAASTFGVYTGQLAANNSSHIYGGDVAAVLSSGNFGVATEVGGGAAIGGVFLPHFSWYSISAGMRVFSRAWLGQTGDILVGTIECKLVVHPQARFKVRTRGSSGAAVAQSSVGSNINFNVGAGPGANLISTFSADDSDLGSGASLPFKIYSIVQLPESDPGAQYNELIVGFNNLTQP